jgi:hypothetical protein
MRNGKSENVKEAERNENERVTRGKMKKDERLQGVIGTQS